MAKRYLGVARDENNTEIINVSDPTTATSAANRQYVDNKLAGLSWKDEVRVASTANGTLATAFENGDTMDGVTLATNDRILLKNQTAQSENGIYTVNASGAPTRATDADATAELNNATVLIVDGTVGAGLSYTQTTKNPTVGSSNIVWVQFNAGTIYTASLGVALSGSDFRLAAGAAGNGLTLTSGALALNPTVAGAGLTHTSGVLAVVATSGGGLTVNADDVGVDSTVSRRYSTGTHASTASIAITHSLGVQFCSGVAVYVTSTGELVDCDVTATSTTQMTFVFATAPGANTLTFVIST